MCVYRVHLLGTLCQREFHVEMLPVFIVKQLINRSSTFGFFYFLCCKMCMPFVTRFCEDVIQMMFFCLNSNDMSVGEFISGGVWVSDYV